LLQGGITILIGLGFNEKSRPKPKKSKDKMTNHEDELVKGE
jgi:hypothetical protein